ncbi:MAG TPA: helix-turn-helix domain-containing protein [Gemmataceae bacterium]|nr:helix-turn-helix domain-containing protein [Gemmataceae bacterium]
MAAVIERAAILGEGKRLEVAQALGGATPPLMKAVISPSAKPARSEEPAEFLTLDAAMSRHIAAALERTRGRIEGPYGAAAILDINPHTLRARMRKLQLDWQRFRTQARLRM